MQSKDILETILFNNMNSDLQPSKAHATVTEGVVNICPPKTSYIKVKLSQKNINTHIARQLFRCYNLHTAPTKKPILTPHTSKSVQRFKSYISCITVQYSTVRVHYSGLDVACGVSKKL